LLGDRLTPSAEPPRSTEPEGRRGTSRCPLRLVSRPLCAARAATGDGILRSDVKANETNIGDLFHRDVRFVAPLYQRPYVWTHDKNWVPMWEAIRLVADRQNRGGSTDGLARPYFLGAIVLEPLNLPTAQVTSWQLIDGQQR